MPFCNIGKIDVVTRLFISYADKWDYFLIILGKVFFARVKHHSSLPVRTFFPDSGAGRGEKKCNVSTRHVTLSQVTHPE
jgi:hypothetical protein